MLQQYSWQIRYVNSQVIGYKSACPRLIFDVDEEGKIWIGSKSRTSWFKFGSFVPGSLWVAPLQVELNSVGSF